MSVNESNLYLKVLGPNGQPHHGGRGRWHLPSGSKPGKWMPTIPDPQPCVRGYHVLADTRQALGWIGPTFWLCEVDGPVITETNKCVVGRARLIEQLPWDDRSARLFAADCAEDVLHIFERAYPGDNRPCKAIEVARRYANGEASESERDAAGDAARAAAWAATRDAAGAATRDAAGDAARAAAMAAAWDAAMAAAGDAAWAAAMDAARAAAGDAAMAAAGDVARAAQAVRLADYLGIEPPSKEPTE